ncbi:uncharacterized protein MONOS_1657 [Monocercomonoides exilis]|uniref:uncharacterized protein n=1 Tax=Monocercomonoides exilis TaxID=2049356 RepID=UPI00355AA19F|nr:hypothetical protein MONOS_1657 [Monocercomonoides exilis]|eukprot:MONOS_1657.1-p1 / transcript=MONOS_1657.1 / gene=MONOS_1657 / organism=Monocercomonoides_exilis_PA203 / gene_product=unspecified product / transcript_product=unspecified product / location=Mono_scaffold00030:149998-154977(+) / protein_length=1660 / sequence_SO=supercontig / SO=protein_coding / is_pseudo=false
MRFPYDLVMKLIDQLLGYAEKLAVSLQQKDEEDAESRKIPCFVPSSILFLVVMELLSILLSIASSSSLATEQDSSWIECLSEHWKLLKDKHLVIFLQLHLEELPLARSMNSMLSFFEENRLYFPPLYTYPIITPKEAPTLSASFESNDFSWHHSSSLWFLATALSVDDASELSPKQLSDSSTIANNAQPSDAHSSPLSSSISSFLTSTLYNISMSLCSLTSQPLDSTDLIAKVITTCLKETAHTLTSLCNAATSSDISQEMQGTCYSCVHFLLDVSSSAFDLSFSLASSDLLEWITSFLSVFEIVLSENSSYHFYFEECIIPLFCSVSSFLIQHMFIEQLPLLSQLLLLLFLLNDLILTCIQGTSSSSSSSSAFTSATSATSFISLFSLLTSLCIHSPLLSLLELCHIDKLLTIFHHTLSTNSIDTINSAILFLQVALRKCECGIHLIEQIESHTDTSISNSSADTPESELRLFFSRFVEELPSLLDRLRINEADVAATAGQVSLRSIPRLYYQLMCHPFLLCFSSINKSLVFSSESSEKILSFVESLSRFFYSGINLGYISFPNCLLIAVEAVDWLSFCFQSFPPETALLKLLSTIVASAPLDEFSLHTRLMFQTQIGKITFIKSFFTDNNLCTDSNEKYSSISLSDKLFLLLSTPFAMWQLNKLALLHQENAAVVHHVECILLFVWSGWDKLMEMELNEVKKMEIGKQKENEKLKNETLLNAKREEEEKTQRNLQATQHTFSRNKQNKGFFSRLFRKSDSSSQSASTSQSSPQKQIVRGQNTKKSISILHSIPHMTHGPIFSLSSSAIFAANTEQKYHDPINYTLLSVSNAHSYRLSLTSSFLNSSFAILPLLSSVLSAHRSDAFIASSAARLLLRPLSLSRNFTSAAVSVFPVVDAIFDAFVAMWNQLKLPLSHSIRCSFQSALSNGTESISSTYSVSSEDHWNCADSTPSVDCAMLCGMCLTQIAALLNGNTQNVLKKIERRKKRHAKERAKKREEERERKWWDEVVVIESDENDTEKTKDRSSKKNGQSLEAEKADFESSLANRRNGDRKKVDSDKSKMKHKRRKEKQTGNDSSFEIEEDADDINVDGDSVISSSFILSLLRTIFIEKAEMMSYLLSKEDEAVQLRGGCMCRMVDALAISRLFRAVFAKQGGIQSLLWLADASRKSGYFSLAAESLQSLVVLSDTERLELEAIKLEKHIQLRRRRMKLPPFSASSFLSSSHSNSVKEATSMITKELVSLDLPVVLTRFISANGLKSLRSFLLWRNRLTERQSELCVQIYQHSYSANSQTDEQDKGSENGTEKNKLEAEASESKSNKSSSTEPISRDPKNSSKSAKPISNSELITTADYVICLLFAIALRAFTCSSRGDAIKYFTVAADKFDEEPLQLLRFFEHPSSAFAVSYALSLLSVLCTDDAYLSNVLSSDSSASGSISSPSEKNDRNLIGAQSPSIVELNSLLVIPVLPSNLLVAERFAVVLRLLCASPYLIKQGILNLLLALITLTTDKSNFTAFNYSFKNSPLVSPLSSLISISSHKELRTRTTIQIFSSLALLPNSSRLRHSLSSNFAIGTLFSIARLYKDIDEVLLAVLYLLQIAIDAVLQSSNFRSDISFRKEYIAFLTKMAVKQHQKNEDILSKEIYKLKEQIQTIIGKFPSSQ